MTATFINVFGSRILLISVFFLIGFTIEHLMPVQRVGREGVLLNISCGALFTFFDVAASMVTISIIARLSLRGMLAALSDHGSLLMAVALAALAMIVRDFFYYWFHRLQHGSKWFWAEHALHHSDEQMNVTTAVRHHWLEMPLNAIFVTMPLMIFRAPVITVPFAFVLIMTVGYFIHMNVRVGFGKWGWLLANPQNHRIHHSSAPEHMDKNFAQFFPLWDVLFGTYYSPRPDEFPQTGLSSGEKVTTLGGAIAMPFQSWAKMLRH
jgi:sterol desaturase/sphingolipid hydroxylase (fatty acid hydroxylase superfamily)